MTRHALFLVSLLLFSCGGSPDETPDLLPSAVGAVADEPESDALITFLPTGAFPSVEALCTKQREMAAPLVTEVNHARAEMYEGISEESVSLEPSCIERRHALSHVTLAAPFDDLTAIEIETGYSTHTILVVHTRAGWTALREGFLTADHDDPGCPSIVRESAFASIRVERGDLVVDTLANRMSFDEEGEGKEVVLTRTRRCTLASCSEPIDGDEHAGL